MTRLAPYLEPYKGRSTRHECPACHDPRSFTRYIDGDTGAVIHPTVGRCNHEAGCGYHYTPKQFFEDNPDRRASFPPSTTSRPTPKPAPPKEPGRIPADYLFRAGSYRSNFVAFLISVFDTNHPGCPTVVRLVDEYGIGAAKDGSVIFWQIDINGRIRTGKIMRYDPTTGKRIKDASGAIDWVHAKLKRRGELPDNFNLVQCLFGEHLLKLHPDKVVALVESEKSALIGAGLFPDLVWLASGGRSQLSADKLRVLAGRTVVLYPDIDSYDLWREKARELEAIGCWVTVSDLLEKNATPADREAKIDIADLLIRQLRAEASAPRPTPVPAMGNPGTEPPATPAVALSHDERALHYLIDINPNVRTLIDVFDLVEPGGKELRTIN